MKKIGTGTLVAFLVCVGLAEAAVVNQWNVDEGSGTTLVDSVGSSDGTFTGIMDWQGSGPGGVSLLCGGSLGDYATLGTIPTNQSVISVSLWAKASGDHSGAALISNHNNAGGDSGFELVFGAAGSLFFRVWNQAGTQKLVGYSAATPFTATDFNDGGWHHFVGTFDGTAASLYVDGVLIEALGLTGDLRDCATAVRLGGRPYSTSPAAYSGYLGGPIQIYDHALTEPEIDALVDAVVISGPVYSVFMDDAVEISWPSVSGTNYLVQYTTDAVNWINLEPGEKIPGNGTTNSVFDSIYTPARSYRVWELDF